MKLTGDVSCNKIRKLVFKKQHCGIKRNDRGSKRKRRGKKRRERRKTNVMKNKYDNVCKLF